jgi:hypothetical protein
MLAFWDGIPQRATRWDNELRGVGHIARVNLTVMSRVLAVLAACLLCVHVARADTIDSNVQQLANDTSYKVRLAAALALSKSRDARAVIALADALGRDEDATIRRICGLALEKSIDSRTAEDARELGLEALEKASQYDPDAKVRDTATKALKALSGLRHKTAAKPANATPTKGDKPPVFVQVDATMDQSKKAPSDAGDRITRIMKSGVESKGYATSWPGGNPTSADLSAGKSRGFIVATTVKKVEVTAAGHQMQIACTVAVRIAPWDGTDGGEKWEANKAASASGSAKAMTGTKERDIASGMRDCLEAVAEDVTRRQVLPFLKRLAGP